MGRQHLTEAERARVRVLSADAHLSQIQICEVTGFGLGQVQRALREAIPKPRSGRPAVLTLEQERELIEFVTTSKKSRRMTFLQLSVVLFNGKYSQYCIRSALRCNGFNRYIAYRKPPISEKNQQLRLQFALDHANWTPEKWGEILWTNETWITHGRHRKTYVTRRYGEELKETCIIDREQRKTGWMFWGCFSGYRKGPGIFWEKDWGSISGETYCQHTIPVIDG